MMTDHSTILPVQTAASGFETFDNTIASGNLRVWTLNSAITENDALNFSNLKTWIIRKLTDCELADFELSENHIENPNLR